MTQVVGIVHWATERTGFRKRSINSLLEDVKAMCAKHGRMDLWRRVKALPRLSYKTAFALRNTMYKGPRVLERYLLKAEEAKAWSSFERGKERRSRNPGANVTAGKRPKKPELRLPDPCAGIGEN